MELNTRGGSLSRQRALALIKAQASDEISGAAATLQRLCLALTFDLQLAGAALTLFPEVGSHAVAAASSPLTRSTEELQFDAGEGPTRDAYHGSEPVVAVNEGSLVAHWPGFAPAALAAGVSAAFSLPLHVGAARFGALTLYWHRPSSPAIGDLRRALVFADLATEFLVDSSYLFAGDGPDPALVSALDTHGHIYQAQGMVMMDLRVGLPEALARMRAQAYASGQNLTELAGQIIAGKTVVVKDPNHNRQHGEGMSK